MTRYLEELVELLEARRKYWHEEYFKDRRKKSLLQKVEAFRTATEDAMVALYKARQLEARQRSANGRPIWFRKAGVVIRCGAKLVGGWRPCGRRKGHDGPHREQGGGIEWSDGRGQ